MKSIFFGMAVSLLVSCSTPGFPGAKEKLCQPEVPSKLLDQLRANYPSLRPLMLADLNAEDQAIWTKAYNRDCPGIVFGKFSGDATEYAVALVPATGVGKSYSVVLVSDDGARDSKFQEIFTETVPANFPVLRKGPPGKYTDLESDKSIVASREVLLIEHLESSITALTFEKGQVQQLQLAE